MIYLGPNLLKCLESQLLALVLPDILLHRLYKMHKQKT
jgi:hypothetical protein